MKIIIIKMTVKNIYKLSIILLFAFILLSCATSPVAFKDIDSAVTKTNFNEAVDLIVQGQEGKNVIYPASNAISLYLDKGLLEHYAENYQNSSNDLQFAERLIETAYTKSITERFFSYIINDNTKEYPGEDFEDIYINVFNALNYYNRGNIEGALVEIRKLSTASGKLDMLARKYNYKDPSTGADLGEMAQRETGVSAELPAAKQVNFSNSALARYLGAVFYLGNGNNDAARVEFDQVYRAFSANKNIYYHPVPSAVEQARNVPAGKARLNIISFAGLSPVKEEARIVYYLPFQHPLLAVVSLKLPVLKRRPSEITRIEAVVNGARFNLELLEDMSAVIEETFIARYSNIVLKTYIRTLLKYTAADIAAIATTVKQGEAAGLLVAIAARTALELSESADIRMSRYLPGRAYIGGINLDPGTYSVIINYYHGNNLIAKAEYNDVVVRQNRPNLLESVNLR